MTFDGRILAQFTVPSGVSISATNSGGGPTSIPLTAGAYYLDAFLAHIQSQLNALRTPANWTVTYSTGVNGTGQVTINWTGTTLTYSIAWTSTTVRDLLGFTADISGVTHGVASTSPKQARGLWIPDAPLMLDGDPGRAPLGSDARATSSPTGSVYGLVGNTFYRHKNVTYRAVTRARVWESQAALANASLEQFLKDTQLGQGTITWFTPFSKVQIYDHNAIQLGIDANGGTGVAGWSMPDVVGIEPAKFSGQWVGLWQVNIGRLLSSG